ncbi:hypothetical protein [Streptomyces exfoliatus]|uniref:hypothetical protein n=1 Tax=Streptomyces exfoliatus TaxID=1905 RepID=UPI0012FEF9C4|nr:hypothetical protein [Streptomyces exfoliatus]
MTSPRPPVWTAARPARAGAEHHAPLGPGRTDLPDPAACGPRAMTTVERAVGGDWTVNPPRPRAGHLEPRLTRRVTRPVPPRDLDGPGVTVPASVTWFSPSTALDGAIEGAARGW